MPTNQTPGLENRVAIVTGASAGIGEAVARGLAASGASVVLNARRADRIAHIAEKIGKETGRKAATAPGDCADPGVIGSMFAAAESAFGRPADLVVANAGRGLNGSVLTSDAGQWEEMIRTNLIGAARLLRASAERMLASVPENEWQRHPRDIVVLGSVVGRNVSPYSGAYGSTKFAVHSLAEGLRREVGPRGIRVTLVEPGFVVSEFQGVAGYDPDWVKSVFEKLGPVIEPEDVARAIVFLTSQPTHVHLSDVVIRPTRQEYP